MPPTFAFVPVHDKVISPLYVAQLQEISFLCRKHVWRLISLFSSEAFLK